MLIIISTYDFIAVVIGDMAFLQITWHLSFFFNAILVKYLIFNAFDKI